MARQLLRAGTSVGANVEEAQAGLSRGDFRCRIGIALKEARETQYWLRLLKRSALVETALSAALIREGDGINRILGAIGARAASRGMPARASS
jgi:four helix bundle protein